MFKTVIIKNKNSGPEFTIEFSDLRIKSYNFQTSVKPSIRVVENNFWPPNIFATFTGRNFVSSKKYLLTSRYKKYGRNFVLKNHDLVKIRPYFIITDNFLGIVSVFQQYPMIFFKI